MKIVSAWLLPVCFAAVGLCVVSGCREDEPIPDTADLRNALVGDGSRVWTPQYAVYIRNDSTEFDTLWYIRPNAATGGLDTVTEPILQQYTADGLLRLSAWDAPTRTLIKDYKTWNWDFEGADRIYIWNDSLPRSPFQRVLSAAGTTLRVALIRYGTTQVYRQYEIVYTAQR